MYFHPALPNVGARNQPTLLEMAAEAGVKLLDSGPDFADNRMLEASDIDWDDILDSRWARERIGPFGG